MFIFAKNTKETVVTTGVIISLLLLVWVAAFSASEGGYLLILSVLCVLLMAAIFRGSKLGYQIGRYFFGVGALIMALGALATPFAYSDSIAEGWSYSSFLIMTLFNVVIAMFVFCCLSEHAKLRNLK